MRIHLVSIFPEIFESFLRTSLVGKAIESGLLEVKLWDPREQTADRHHTVDDTPYGGGDGMVMKVEPLIATFEAIDASIPRAAHRALLTPQGEPLRQQHLAELAQLPELALVCGRYEGFDERVRLYVHRQLSLGDFVLNGGEVAAMAVLDGIARLVPGVIGKQGSLAEESHTDGLLEYPQYTRPRSFRGHEVPEELVSGDHEAIRRWRRRERLLRTRSRRPDLWARFQPTEEDLALTAAEPEPLAELAARTYIALLHHPVYDRNREVVTTAITNLDVHDIARSTCTYGLAGYYVVTPLTSQRELALRIVEHWRTGHGAVYNKRRAEALSLLDVAESLEAVSDRILEREGRRPLTVVTSAIARPGQLDREALLRRVPAEAPLLILLGTGWGLTEEFVARADLALAPVRGRPAYNHLSVRSAAAILLDRLFGLRD